MDPVKEDKELYENLESYYKRNENHENNCFKEFIKDTALIVIPLVLVVGGAILVCFLL
jgi:hypothetical protein